jgi:hypothetical protein
LFWNRQPDIPTGVQPQSGHGGRAGLAWLTLLTWEGSVRAFFYLILFTVVINVAAFADESVAGSWRANLGDGVVIDMVVKPDGAWSSEMFHKKQVVKQMRGTYKQTPSSNEAGTIVFVPTKYSVKSGAVKTETDQYELAEGGKQLKLTADGDTMVFEKREKR